MNNIQSGKKISITMQVITALLNHLARIIEHDLTKDQYNEEKRKIGRLMSEILSNHLMIEWDKHPSLLPTSMGGEHVISSSDLNSIIAKLEETIINNSMIE